MLKLLNQGVEVKLTASTDAIRRLMGYVYVKPTLGKKGRRKRKFGRYPKTSFPSPLCSKSVSKFADQMCLEAGLEDLTVEFGGGGAQFNPEKIVSQLIQSLPHPSRPDQVHIQVLGDGFRAMKSCSIVCIGARLLIESEEGAGETSFTAITEL